MSRNAFHSGGRLINAHDPTSTMGKKIAKSIEGKTIWGWRG